MDILQQIAQALQRAVQPVAVSPQRLAIERMAKYRPVDFLEKKDDEPSMAENWLERTKRMMRQMHYTPEVNLERATSLLHDEAYQWWLSVTRTAPPEGITWEFFLLEFRKQYVGHIYLSNMRQEFHNLKQRQMSVTEYQREFTRLSKYAPDSNVSAISGTENLIEGSERVNIMLLNGIRFYINDALYSSKSTRNLLSFKDIPINGYHIETMNKGSK